MTTSHHDASDDNFADHYSAKVCYEALMQRLQQSGIPSPWRSVDESMPVPDEPVLVWFRTAYGCGSITRAIYVAPQADAEQAEFVKENGLLTHGWWENPVAGGRLTRIAKPVEFWMPLPVGPLATTPYDTLLQKLMLTRLAASWLNAEDRTPTPDETVLVWYRTEFGSSRLARAFYVGTPAATERSSSSRDYGRLAQGWWEELAVGGSINRIDAPVAFWMSMPAGPLMPAAANAPADSPARAIFNTAEAFKAASQ